MKNEILSPNEVKALKNSISIGAEIILEEMKGENLPKNLKGKVYLIDDIGQIHVAWENGSNLALNPVLDKYHFINK